MGSRVNRKSLLYNIGRLNKTVTLFEAKWRTFLDDHVQDFIKAVAMGIEEGYAPIYRPKVVSFDDAMYCREILISPRRDPTKKYPSKAILLAFKKFENIYAAVEDMRDWLGFLLVQLAEFSAFEKREETKKTDAFETHNERYMETLERYRDWPTEKKLRFERGHEALHQDLVYILAEPLKCRRFGMLLSHISFAIDCAKDVLLVLGPTVNAWMLDANTTVIKDHEEAVSSLKQCRREASKLGDSYLESFTFSTWPVCLGYIGREGGILHIKDAGIQLYVPQALISENIVQELYVNIESADSQSADKMVYGIDDGNTPFLTVSPVVRLGPVRLKMNEPLLLTIPHCAKRVAASKFKMAYSSHRIGDKSTWRMLASHELQMVVNDNSVVALVKYGGCYQVKVESNGNDDEDVWKIVGVGLFSSPIKDFMRPDVLKLQVYIWNATVADREAVQQVAAQHGELQLVDTGYMVVNRTGKQLIVMVTPPNGWKCTNNGKRVALEAVMSMGVIGGCQIGWIYCRRAASLSKTSTPRSANVTVNVRQLRTKNAVSLRYVAKPTPVKKDEISLTDSTPRDEKTDRNIVDIIKSRTSRIMPDAVFDRLCNALDKKSDMVIIVDGAVKCMDYRCLAKDMAFNVSVHKYWKNPEPLTKNFFRKGKHRGDKNPASSRSSSSASITTTYYIHGWEALGTQRPISVTSRDSSGRYGNMFSSPIRSRSSMMNGYGRPVNGVRPGSRTDSATTVQSNHVAGSKAGVLSYSRPHSTNRVNSSRSGKSISFELDQNSYNPNKRYTPRYQSGSPRVDTASCNEHCATYLGERESLDNDHRWKNPAKRLLHFIISEEMRAEKCRAEILEKLWRMMGNIGNIYAQQVLYDGTVLTLEQTAEVAEVIADIWPVVARNMQFTEDEIAAVRREQTVHNWDEKNAAKRFLTAWISVMEKQNERPALMELLRAVEMVDKDLMLLLGTLL